jgi:hypothetical protein
MPRKKRSLYELPGYAERGGYVYAVLYSTGIVRVGRTDHARGEITAIRKEARAAGIELADWWVSVPHEEWVANERRLAETCRANGTRTGAGRYSGLDFRLVAGKANDLPFTSTGLYAAGRRHRHRETEEGRDKRMAIAVRHRAAGMKVREIAERLSVSHTTIENDLARWKRVRDQMPLEIIRLSRPPGNQPWQTEPGSPSSREACLPGEVASDAGVIAFRRLA